MLMNTYTLPELVDLALHVPEPGAVNFNILHAVLHAVIAETGLTEVRPWCHVESPVVAQAALTNAKLRGTKLHHRSVSTSALSSTDLSPRHIAASRTIRRSEIRPSDAVLFPEIAETSKKLIETTDRIAEESTDKTADDSSDKATDDSTERITDDIKPLSSITETAENEDVTAQESESFTTDENVDDASPTQEIEESGSSKASPPQDPALKQLAHDSDEDERKSVADEIEEILRVGKQASFIPDEKEKHVVFGRGWELTNLTSRMEASEEGLLHLSVMVDQMADHFKKTVDDLHTQSQAKKVTKDGPPLSQEMEVFDSKITDIEESIEQFEKDHDLLRLMETQLKILTDEFEKVKALGDEIGGMLLDIEKKADKVEVQEALDKKGDLVDLLKKVDRDEFETASEELGEAIGSLAIKYQLKNEEWDKRANAIWDGINTKMSADIFEANRKKVEERLTAEMFAIRKMQKIIDVLLTPPASAITKCLTCGRPAALAGGKTIGDGDNKSEFQPQTLDDFDEFSEDFQDQQSVLMQGFKGISPKNKYLTSSTILSLPYSDNTGTTNYSFSNSSSIPSGIYHHQFSMQPVNESSSGSSRFTSGTSFPSLVSKSTYARKNKRNTSTVSSSQVPSLPALVDTSRCLSKNKAQSSQVRKPPVIVKETKSRYAKPLHFTNMLVAQYEEDNEAALKLNQDSSMLPKPLEEENLSNPQSPSSATDLENSLDSVIDPVNNTYSFAPVRLMQNPKRRDIIVDHKTIQEYSPKMDLISDHSNRVAPNESSNLSAKSSKENAE